MAKHTTLTALFQDIAASLREQKENTAKIVADNFPDEIRSLKVIDTFDGTITENDILNGKKGYSQGKEVVGEIPITNMEGTIDGKTYIKGSITTIKDSSGNEYDVITLPNNTYLNNVEYLLLDPQITYLVLDDGASTAPLDLEV